MVYICAYRDWGIDIFNKLKGIYDIVDKLDVLSLEKKRQLTIPLIKEIL